MTHPAPSLEHRFSLQVKLGAPIELGAGRAGARRIIPILGGRALGPAITGEVLNLGADWQTSYADGSINIDTRYAVRSDDGAVIEIVNVGTRYGPPEVMEKLAKGEEVDPASYKMRSAARLECGDPRYTWVNNTIFVCTGVRLPLAVEIAFYEVI